MRPSRGSPSTRSTRWRRRSWIWCKHDGADDDEAGDRRQSPAPGGAGQIWLTRTDRADLRLAAWFAWMMPLDAALSRLRHAAFSSISAAALSPASAAVRTLRTLVLSEDFTDLLR